MSNLSLNNLVLSIENFLKERDPKVSQYFTEQIRIALANSFTTYTDFFSGLSTNDFTNAIREALMATANYVGTGSPLYNIIWNPINAALLNTISVDCKSVDKETVNRMRALDLKESKIKNTVAGTSKVDNNPLKPVKITSISKPKPEVCPIEKSDIIKTMKSKRIFFNQAHIKCKLEGCNVCLDIFKEMALSKCSDIKSHKKKEVCHPSGWYVHIAASHWSKLRHRHGPIHPPGSPIMPNSSLLENGEPQFHPMSPASITIDSNISWADECPLSDSELTMEMDKNYEEPNSPKRQRLSSTTSENPRSNE